MSIYHPIMDDEKRVWNLRAPSFDDFKKWGLIFAGDIVVALTKKGYIVQLYQHSANAYYIGTCNSLEDGWAGDYQEPLWEDVPKTFWETYIVPHIIQPSMIDMTGEFDGDDIELAQIIMDEIEEGRR